MDKQVKMKGMRVAVVNDIHANLPALEAVLKEFPAAGIDQVVVGGDVFPGPMPRETIAKLLGLDIPVQFIYGNGELAMLAQMRATDPNAVTYWGTTSGEPLPESLRPIVRWSAEQLRPDYEPLLASWPMTLRLQIDGLGDVLFCHGTPRSEVECFTSETREDLLWPVFEGLRVGLVVCGHTHMQFDRMIGGTRVVNAGSVGAPFGEPGADWLLLGPGVELRHTTYDLESAAARIRSSGYPQADEFAAENVLRTPSRAAMIEAFTSASFR